MLAAPAIEQAVRTPGISSRDQRWLLEDLVAMPGKEAAPKMAWLGGRLVAGMEGGRLLTARFYYRCRRFDPVTRLCTSRDDLPSACEEYPWGDSGPHPAKTIPPWCGYNVDVGRPVEPVPVALTRRPSS